MVIRLDKYLCDMQAGTRSAVKDIIRKKKLQSMVKLSHVRKLK